MPETSDDRVEWACPRCGDPGYVIGNELRCGNPGCDDTHAYDPATGERSDYGEAR